MKALRYIHKAPVRVLKITRLSSKLKIKRTMLVLRTALAQEKAETKIMLTIYRKHTKGQASKEELTIANQQFLDVLRGIGLGVFAILPLAPITIPLIVKLGQRVGVEVMPSSFSQKKKRTDNKAFDNKINKP